MPAAHPEELTFDHALWRERLELPRAHALLATGRVIGPQSLIHREQALEAIGRSARIGSAVPVDVFVWARGEPPRRDATKYGGLPYWPKSRPWPSRADEPLPFLGQLRIAGSRDLFADAGGDLLLAFGDAHEGWDVTLAWVELTRSPLVEMTACAVPFRPCWAQVHRTFELADLPDPSPSTDLAVAVIEGTKIGGLPVSIQPGAEPARVAYRATFGSLDVGPSQPWPFLDAERVTPEEALECGPLWGGDGGSAYVVRGGSGFELNVVSY